jgi:DNA repair exonuclease SbcCD ATPase subunit
MLAPLAMRAWDVRQHLMAWERASRWNTATTWIMLVAFLGAAVIGLGVWVVILERDHETESSTATARIAELEGLQAELAEQVPKLEGVVNDLQDQLGAEKAAAADAAQETQTELDAAREEVDRLSEELGTKGRQFSEIEAELEQLAQQAEAELAAANDATGSARDRATAQRARADLAEACLGAVAEVLRGVYTSENPEEALAQAEDEFRAIAADCGPSE